MDLRTIIYRDTIKLTQGVTGMLAKIQTYFYNKKSITTDVNILYPDGLYSVNTDTNILAVENDVKNLYSGLYQDEEALRIIKLMSMEEKDVFLGREDVYVLLKNTDNKLTAKGDNVEIVAGEATIVADKDTNKITIKNDATDLKTLLTQNISIDNAFFASLNTALATSNFTQFQASLTPTIAGYISQKTAVNNLIISLLNS